MKTTAKQRKPRRASSCTSRNRTTASTRTMEKALASWAIEQFPCLCGANRKPNATHDGRRIRRTVDGIVGCSHDWREPVDTQFCNEKYTEVKCTKCGMVGEKTIATGEVFFPAT